MRRKQLTYEILENRELFATLFSFSPSFESAGELEGSGVPGSELEGSGVPGSVIEGSGVPGIRTDIFNGSGVPGFTW